jgi:hypothetical protein
MEKESVLNQVINTPDDELRDDDHLERKDLTDEEATQGFKELVEKYKDQKAVKPKSKAFAQGIINVLNNPSNGNRFY